jgi:hypothetical protein
MKGTVKEWKHAIEHARANAAAYAGPAQRPYSGPVSTGTWKGRQFRQTAWKDVAEAITEALRLESLPEDQA